MKHTDYVKEFLILVLLIGPMAYLGIIWNMIPAEIPTNFNMNGVADGVVNKREFLLLMIFLFLRMDCCTRCSAISQSGRRGTKRRPSSGCT